MWVALCLTAATVFFTADSSTSKGGKKMRKNDKLVRQCNLCTDFECIKILDLPSAFACFHPHQQQKWRNMNGSIIGHMKKRTAQKKTGRTYQQWQWCSRCFNPSPFTTGKCSTVQDSAVQRTTLHYTTVQDSAVHCTALQYVHHNKVI